MAKFSDKKHPYESPTTPGLYVTLSDFIVELICLNMNPKLGAKFWRDDKYWKTKYVREISRGIQKLKELLIEFDLEDNIVRISLIRTVKNSNIKSLLVEKTRNVLLKKFKREYYRLLKTYDAPNNPSIVIDPKTNSTFIDPPKKTILGKLREIEEKGFGD